MKFTWMKVVRLSISRTVTWRGDLKKHNRNNVSLYRQKIWKKCEREERKRERMCIFFSPIYLDTRAHDDPVSQWRGSSAGPAHIAAPIDSIRLWRYQANSYCGRRTATQWPDAAFVGDAPIPHPLRRDTRCSSPSVLPPILANVECARYTAVASFRQWYTRERDLRGE